jgi:hypothetical protein
MAANFELTPQELLDRLGGLFPDFRACWDDASNCYRSDDGSFTLHGVFSEFTDFFRERYASLPPSRIEALGAFVSDCMASGGTDLDNATGTCFLENIAGEPCSRGLGQNLSGQAYTYWQAWGGPGS